MNRLVPQVSSVGRDVTVTCNHLSVNAKAGRIADGLEALVWLIKKNGGQLSYGDALREMKNPQHFGRWMTERFRKEGSENG
jgi:hypothetical protein